MNSESRQAKHEGIRAVQINEMAHPRGGFSYVLACNSTESESREPVLQPVMYPRMYHPCPLEGSRQASTSENIPNLAGAGKGHRGAMALVRQCSG